MDNQSRRTTDPLDILIAAVVPAAIVFLLNPLLIAWTNVQDMELPVSVIARGAAVAMVVAFAAGLGVLWLGERLGWRRLVPVTMAAGLMLWLHSAVLVWDYGVLDGRSINWREHQLAGFFEVLLWCGALGGALGCPEAVRVFGRRVLPALLLLHSTSVALTAWQAPPPPSFHTYSLATENRETFSSDRNVILIVLDAFQADMFAGALHQRPELAEEFEGFTYFRNAVSGYSKTYPSPALMLTGEFYENQEPLQQFLERVYMEHSVPAKLMKAGWDVGLYPYVSRTLHFDPAIASNIRQVPRADNTLVEVAGLLDLGLFRAAPHFVKREIVNDHEWRLRQRAALYLATGAQSAKPGERWRSSHPHRDVRLVEELERNGRIDTDKPVFRYFHFLTPHAPFLLNEKFEMEDLAGGREGFLRSSHVAVNLVARVFAKLRELQVYDDTAILIVSDHGGGEYGAGVDARFAGREIAQHYDDELSAFEHASGLPLILLKPARSRGEMQVSDAPVSLADVAATLDALTIDTKSFSGKPLHLVEENEARSRRYLFYKFDGWRAQYLPAMKEFAVEGFSWDTASWRATGNVFTGANEPIEDAAEEGSFTPLNGFVATSSDAGLAALAKGWWDAEGDFAWSRGKQSELIFRFSEKPRGEVLVTLRLAPHLGRGKLETQRVIVRHQGVEIATLNVNAFRDYKFLVSLSPEGGEGLRLSLEMPDAVSPASLLTSTDERVLGVAIYGFRVDAASAVSDDEMLFFGARDQGVSLLREGWSAPEARFTWTDASQASLQLPLTDELRGRELELTFRLRPFVAPPQLERQRVMLFADDEKLGEWSIQEQQRLRVFVPGSLTGDGVVDLMFELPDATAAYTVMETKDLRKLGVALFELEVEEK